MRAISLATSIYLFQIFGAPVMLNAFEVETHTLLSEKATQASQLNDYLTSVLAFEFPQGILEVLKAGQNGRVQELIAKVGAVNEDNPEFRSRNHFHDPTKAWAQAGLTGLFGTYQTSVLWSQNPNQDFGEKHSWQDARNSYFNALTATNTADRKKYYAETFVSLGHLIHHVQDAATPAHTRNDWHLGLTTGNNVFPFLNVDRFHQWAAKAQGENAINLAGSLPFDPAILNQTYNELVPIAGILDTTTTAGPATPSAATNIGIAEYSNANFFSDDTILKDYAYPNITQMELSHEAGPDGPEPRPYLRKSFAPGPIGYRAAVSTSLIDKLPVNFPTQQLELDGNVMADYGAQLFPRAIGYSAGLIDYFFRNGLSGFASDVGCGFPQYRLEEFILGVANFPASFFFGGEYTGPQQLGPGRFVIVVHYKHGGQSHYFTLLDTVATLPENAYIIIATLSMSQMAQVPTDATDLFLVAAYRGPLGQETDAVIGGVGSFIGLC